jgi:hypothetical protein
MEGQRDDNKDPLNGNDVLVEKCDAKRGVLFIEAKIRDDVISNPHQKVLVSKVSKGLFYSMTFSPDIEIVTRRSGSTVV